MTTQFTINDVAYWVDPTDFPADITLNTFIREHAQLTATKFMCLEGGCGACVCVIKGKHPVSGEMRTWAANSCLTLLNTCADWEIITSEGIGNKRIGYHPIQKRLAKMNGSQCGFCSPGFVMNMYGLLESKKGSVTMEEVENSFGGNICRCTGYRPILDAMKSFSIDSNVVLPPECKDIEDLCVISCPKTDKPCSGDCQKDLNALTYSDGRQWYWPKTLAELFDVLGKVGNEGEYMLVAGNTAHGVYRRSPAIKDFIDINAIPELHQHEIGHDMLTLGGNLSLTDAMGIFLEAASQPGFEYCQQLWRHFDLIANVPVRNNGTLAGNISIKKAHPEFQSDVFLLFEALHAQVVYEEVSDIRTIVPLSVYLGETHHKAVIIAFELPAYPKEHYIFTSYKVTPRAQNAHAIVNAAFLFEITTANGIVSAARICFGGIRADFTHAFSAESILVGQNPYDKETVTAVFHALLSEVQPEDILPDLSPEYRQKLACGLFYKFLLNTAPPERVGETYRSGGELLKRLLSSGSQTFTLIARNDPVGKPVEKVEAMIQCSGEATYMNDTLTTANAVYCAFVTATKVGATIEYIDASEALGVRGVVAFLSAKDIPGTNTFVELLLNYEKEEVFSDGLVRYYDQPLGIIVASTSDIAHHAATKVKVLYSHGNEVTFPALTDVLDAYQMVGNSFLDRNEMADKPDITVRGIYELGSQYHYTMEPQTTIVAPFERGLQVWCATQWMDHTQSVIAKMLNMNISDVQLKVRRLGGAYGGKITRGNQVACAAALAAHTLNLPVRFVQRIESMMSCNGKRWSVHAEYEVHAKANGKMLGLETQYYVDAGCTRNEKILFDHTKECIRNCYQFAESNFKVKGEAALTDAVTTSWCRAPGSVEGIALGESIVEHLAFEVNRDPADVRLENLVPGQKMEQLLPQFLKSTEYRKRRKEIDDFNAKNRWRKRGLGLAIMRYPIFYVGPFAVTVAIYHCDGTVVISHGGIEMGQGMNTKVSQVAAYILDVPLTSIKIEASDTINGANSFVTGASIGSESLCFAVRKACQTLSDRLKPIRASLGSKATWPEIVHAAWLKMVNLIASDQCNIGDMQTYDVFGLGLSELEIDMLTGNYLIKRVDIEEDTGESLSPNIDVGQVEGAFVMGLGYFLTEELVYDRSTGKLLTNRTWNYKPPGAKDIPIDFRIKFLQNPNSGGFMRSKATGEPPFCLAVSASFAIEHALQSARKDAGLKREWIRLGAPTTTETIVLNSGNEPSTFSLD